MSLPDGLVKLDGTQAAASEAPTERPQSSEGLFAQPRIPGRVEAGGHPGRPVEASDERGDEVRLDHGFNVTRPAARHV
jgi:hypothetical protein